MKNILHSIPVIPFCTSASGDIAESGDTLTEHAGTGIWLHGKRFSGDASDSELQAWIDETKEAYTKKQNNSGN